MTLDPRSPIAICKGAPRPFACALTRATRLLVMRDDQLAVTGATSTDYAWPDRLLRAGLVVVVGVAIAIGASRAG